MPRLAGSPVLQSALPSIVAIFGPTASGKTAVAEAVAERLGGEVVSADSMQAYRGLPILTAQPERPTRLVGIWSLSHEGTMAEYAQLAHAAIDEILTAGRTPVVAGGTGLYLRAALAQLELPPAPSPEQRAQWEHLYDRLGAERAYGVLVTPARRRGSIPTTDGASSGRSSSPSSAPRCGRLQIGCGHLKHAGPR
jgi:tRNA dimethylallyltransferase